MSRFTHAKFAALAAANQARTSSNNMEVGLEPRSISEDDDEEYTISSSGGHKRKRAAPTATEFSPSPLFSHATPSHSTHQSLSFPLLSDDEPSLHTVLLQTASSSSSSSSSFERVAQPTSFSCVSKSLFSLADESRDRGSAKLAIVHIQLRHACFANNSINFTTSFKIDGRKSFSNAPFKKHYTRAIHAAWFASSTGQMAATNPAPNAVESTPTNGRVMLLISQRNGRPNGKGFTGLKHDTSSYSSKHPLLCLSSNSVEYYLSVFINQTEQQLDGEDPESAPESWCEVETEVSARFDAGEVTLDPVSFQASPVVPAKRQRVTVLPIVRAAAAAAAAVAAPSSSVAAAAAAASAISSLSSIVDDAASASTPSSSPAMSRSTSASSTVDSMLYAETSAAVMETPRELSSPVPSASEYSSADSPFTDPTEYDSSASATSGTPLHEQQDVLNEPQFHLADDQLIGGTSSMANHIQADHNGGWCPMAEEEEEELLSTPTLVRNSTSTSEAMFAFEQQQSSAANFPVNPFSEESASSSPPQQHQQAKRARLVIHMDPLFEHGLILPPLMSDMSWAATMSSFPALASPVPSPQPQPEHQSISNLSLAF